MKKQRAKNIDSDDDDIVYGDELWRCHCWRWRYDDVSVVDDIVDDDRKTIKTTSDDDDNSDNDGDDNCTCIS